MDQRVSMVTLGVADVPRARFFYEYGLGWCPVDLSSDDLAIFRAGSVLIGLCPRGELAADTGIDDTGPFSRFGGMTLAYAARSKEQVVLILTRAAASGAQVTRQAAKTFWGGYSGCFTDLDGHVWEVTWNPDWSESTASMLLS